MTSSTDMLSAHESISDRSYRWEVKGPRLHWTTHLLLTRCWNIFKRQGVRMRLGTICSTFHVWVTMWIFHGTTHHCVSLFCSQLKRCKASGVGNHIKGHLLVQLCIACHNQVNDLAGNVLVGLQDQNVKHCVACMESVYAGGTRRQEKAINC